MPENGKPVNTHWLVGIVGRDEELLVYAAYPQYHDAKPAQGGSDPVVLALKDAGHKVVFEAPVASVDYVRRADVTGKIDRNATPNQVISLKTELKQAAGTTVPGPPVQVTMGPLTTSGAAPVPQTMYLNFPAPGQEIG